MFDFPSAPTEGQEFTPPGGPTYLFASPRWLVKGGSGGSGGGGDGEAAWDEITGKPATFPPTLPIPSSGVSGLDAAQSAQDTAINGKAPTVHTHAQSDVTGLTTALDGKAPTVHTHTQSDVSGLDTALAGKADVVHTHNYSSLTGIPATFAPSAHNHPQSEVTNLVADLAAKEVAANKGVADGYAALDSGGKIPAIQLPSYVDDVQEFADLAAFPATGTAGIIYVALDTNRTYRWSGSVYVEISASPGSTDAVPEGSVNLYHTTLRAAAAAPVQSVATKTGAVTLVKGDVGLGNVDNTSDADKPVSTAQAAAIATKEPTISSGTTAQYWRGDKSWQTLPPSGISDAPGGGVLYVRMNNGWVENPIQIDAPDSSLYARRDSGWEPLPVETISTDAPWDGTPYARQNSDWVPIAAGGGGDTWGLKLSYMWTDPDDIAPEPTYAKTNNAGNEVWLSWETANGEYPEPWMLTFKVGDYLVVQGQDDPTSFSTFKITEVDMSGGEYVIVHCEPGEQNNFGPSGSLAWIYTIPGGNAVAWDDVTDKPGVFPPSLPIPQSGVSGLEADLAAKAPLASPTFTGNPQGPTPSPGDNDTSLATTGFVVAAITAALASVAGGAVISDTAPSHAQGKLWWDSSTGNLYVSYDDGTSVQWVQVNTVGTT